MTQLILNLNNQKLKKKLLGMMPRNSKPLTYEILDKSVTRHRVQREVRFSYEYKGKIQSSRTSVQTGE